MNSHTSRESVLRELSHSEEDSWRNAAKRYAVERKNLEDLEDTLEHNIKSLRDQLNATRQAWFEVTKNYEAERDSVKRLRGKLDVYREKYENAEERLRDLKESIADLLSISEDEADIKQTIKSLIVVRSQQGRIIDSLKQSLESLEKKHQDTVYEYNLTREKYDKNELERMELAEIISKDERQKDELKTRVELGDMQQEKFVNFLTDLSNTMGFSEIMNDYGEDYNMDLLLARAKQLQIQDNFQNHNKSVNIRKLKERIRQLEDRVVAKEIQIDMLKKKNIHLGKDNKAKDTITMEKNQAIDRSKLLKKEKEKLQLQLSRAEQEIASLKTRLAESSAEKIKYLEIDRACDNFQKCVTELEVVCLKQSQKIKSLNRTLQNLRKRTDLNEELNSRTVQALKQEINNNKEIITNSKERENQLLDLRSNIARILDLDSKCLTVSDFDILSKLHKTVHVYNEYNRIAGKYPYDKIR